MSALKQGARAGWLLVSRTLGFFAAGILINWGLSLILSISAWNRHCPGGTCIPDVKSGYGAAIWVLTFALSHWWVPLAAAILLFLFPFLYLMAGKSRGIKAALASIAKDNRGTLHAWLEPVMRSAFRSAEAAGRGSRAKGISALLSKGLDRTANLPGPLRWLLKSLLKKSGIARLMEELKDLGGEEAAALAKIRSRIDEGISEQLRPGWEGPAMLFAANAAFAAAVYWLTRG